MKIFEITEQPNDDIVSLITQHCSKYLAEIGGIDNALFKYPLWRGLGHYTFLPGAYAEIAPVNQNRMPTGNSVKTQTELDNWFQEKFGIRFRQSSVFCTGDIVDANSYSKTSGTTVAVLPIGNYDYCWSPDVGDLFIELQRNRGLSIPQLLDQSNYRCNERLQEAVQSNFEVMLHCKSVLMVSSNWPGFYEGSI